MDRFDWGKYESLLGTMPDRALARRIGCTPMAVCYQRNRRGISAFGRARAPGTAVRLTLPEPLVTRIDLIARDRDRSRSDVAAELLQVALS